MDGQLRTALGVNLLRRREELGLSQEEFAKILGFNRKYLSRLERGQGNPSLRRVEIYAKSLELDARYLLRE